MHFQGETSLANRPPREKHSFSTATTAGVFRGDHASWDGLPGG